MEPLKKSDQSLGSKTLITFFSGSFTFHRSWIVFSDSPYQKLPLKPFHIVPFRNYVPRPYFHVSHARDDWSYQVDTINQNTRSFWLTLNSDTSITTHNCIRNNLRYLNSTMLHEFIKIQALTVECKTIEITIPTCWHRCYHSMSNVGCQRIWTHEL